MTTKFDPSQIKAIIEDMYTCGIVESLKKHNVSVSTFYDALHENPLLEEIYIRAQTAQVEIYAEEIVQIADSDENPQKVRNQVDARKWIASKIRPAKYGDRIDLNINQTVDIKGALLDAKLRVKDVIDITKQSTKLVTDSKSVVEDHEITEAPQSIEELLGIPDKKGK